MAFNLMLSYVLSLSFFVFISWSFFLEPVDSTHFAFHFDPFGKWEAVVDGSNTTLVIIEDESVWKDGINPTSDIFEDEITQEILPIGVKINGTLFGDPIVGYFDNNSNRIIFLQIDANDTSKQPVYTGIADRGESKPWLHGTCVKYTLVGQFEGLSGPEQGSENIHGWYAQQEHCWQP